MRLSGKSILITGAGSGMGLAMATRFAAEGAQLVIGDWNAGRLDQAVETIRASGGVVVGSHGDIGDQLTAEGLVDLAVTRFGRLDVLVNNAGVMDYMEGVGELSDDIWRRVMRINVDGPMFTSRRAVQRMLAGEGGGIINIASIGGLRGGAAGAAYTTSKHALVGLTLNTAWMYAKRGIRCNAICPGATSTNIGDTMTPDRINHVGMARAMEFAALSPAMLEASDIADAALFLASDEARRVNGAIISVDGGWAAN